MRTWTSTPAKCKSAGVEKESLIKAGFSKAWSKTRTAFAKYLSSRVLCAPDKQEKVEYSRSSTYSS